MAERDKSEREERLVKALRDNLRRRKAAGRDPAKGARDAKHAVLAKGQTGSR